MMGCWAEWSDVTSLGRDENAWTSLMARPNFIFVVRTEPLCLLGSCGTDRIDVPFQFPFQNDVDAGRGTFGGALLPDKLQGFA